MVGDLGEAWRHEEGAEEVLESLCKGEIDDVGLLWGVFPVAVLPDEDVAADSVHDGVNDTDGEQGDVGKDKHNGDNTLYIKVV